MLNLAQKDIGNGKKGFANASDCLETWDDSDSITAVNAQNDLRQSQKWWHNHSEAQYQGFRDQQLTYRSGRNWTEAYIQQSYKSTD